MAKDIKFNIKLNIDGKQVVVQASENVKELQRNLMAAKTSGQQLSATLIKFNQIAQVCSNVNGALSTLGGIMSGYIAKANSATEAQTKLTTVMRQRMGATEDDTEAINKAVASQTQLGIVSGTVQRSGLQQLATFASQRQTLETLLPAMNNLLAQQKGLNATNEDAVSGQATVVGAAITLLGVGLEKLISYFTRASDSSAQLKQSVNDTGNSFEKQREQALAPVLTKYQEPQAKLREAQK